MPRSPKPEVASPCRCSFSMAGTTTPARPSTGALLSRCAPPVTTSPKPSSIQVIGWRRRNRLPSTLQLRGGLRHACRRFGHHRSTGWAGEHRTRLAQSSNIRKGWRCRVAKRAHRKTIVLWCRRGCDIARLQACVKTNLQACAKIMNTSKRTPLPPPRFVWAFPGRVAPRPPGGARPIASLPFEVGALGPMSMTP